MIMDDSQLKTIGSGSMAPITEADLHAYVDGQLTPERKLRVEQFLSTHPDEHARVQDWQQQNVLMQDMLASVIDEPLPLSLSLQPTTRQFPWYGLAAGVLIAGISAGSAWTVRGAMEEERSKMAFAQAISSTTRAAVTDGSELTGFAQRAAIAHAVYSPDLRRPVEVSADQEQALVTWLTKRMGTTVRPPALTALGYELIGGRLLPGEQGPVAQFMYVGAGGQRLTLYVTREVPRQSDAEFKFGKNGPVNVFYWIENNFGYAISAGTDKAELMRVSQEVYRQLKPE